MSTVKRHPRGLRTKLRMAGRLDPSITAPLRKEVEEFGGAVLDRMLAGAPRDTGQAAAELRSKVSSDGLAVKVGILGLRASRKAWYLKFKEFGTVKMPAEPFMVPAFEQNRARVAKMADALRQAMKKLGL